MRILLVTTAYDGLSQRVHVELNTLGHDVSIELALGDELLREAVALFHPDLILCPFLQQTLPADIQHQYTCISLQPGYAAMVGVTTLEQAILNGAETWGIMAVETTDDPTTKRIWATATFPLRMVSRASIYRNEVTDAAAQVALESVRRVASGTFVPTSMLASPTDHGQTWPLATQQPACGIDWSTDSTAQIIRKINAADGGLGLLDTVAGQSVYLYGAHGEGQMHGQPGAIIAQRHGAICRATVDGAVWISHLKQKPEGDQLTIKLPAATVLGDRLQDVPESPIETLYQGRADTFREIWYEEQNEVGYLYFDFHNGAFSTAQLGRLHTAFLAARRQPTKVIVLMGGMDFWSNGMHLNLVEAAADPAEASIRNCNAIDDLMRTIITTDSHLIVSAMRGSAGASGVILALIADKVCARTGIILNPHYQTMGLYGSAYWTYLLPQRVGQQRAISLAANCLPMGVKEAFAIGLIDTMLPADFADCDLALRQMAEALAHSPDYERRLAQKRAKRFHDEKLKPLAAYRAEEFAQLRNNLYGADPAYHVARFNFVHKIAPQATPLRLAKHRQVGVLESAAAAVTLLQPVAAQSYWG
ncbi:MAG: enoyl-CoA hydratase-related protein [Chloroflexi bacterium]|nr:enoyl-CoA hydratase-related protein [Chloroflexota bacterium]